MKRLSEMTLEELQIEKHILEQQEIKDMYWFDKINMFELLIKEKEDENKN